MTSRGGSLYIGTLTPFPVKVGAAEIFKVNPRTGQFSVIATGLTTVLGLAFGADGALYVLEMSVKNGGPAPNTGELVRIKGSHRTLIATGLNFPTGMAFGPDGNPVRLGQRLRRPARRRPGREDYCEHQSSRPMKASPEPG
jgi:sugar lactone lactonase YvrE